MIYLESFKLPSQQAEEEVLHKITNNFFEGYEGPKRRLRNDYLSDNIYPFNVLSQCRLEQLDFEPVTILYGGNGSGKSTILNIISTKLKIPRSAPYNITQWMKDYLKMCSAKKIKSKSNDYTMAGRVENEYVTKMITSDDVFKYMLDKRAEDDKNHFLNEKFIADIRTIRRYPERAVEVYNKNEELKKFDLHKLKKDSVTQMFKNIRGAIEPNLSNGETGLTYLFEQIADKGLYLLDEPENSLSCEFQMRLVEYIELSVKVGLQFIIATHSPFLLSIPNAKIYNLGAEPATVSKWYELENMKFFCRSQRGFKKK